MRILFEDRRIRFDCLNSLSVLNSLNDEKVAAIPQINKVCWIETEKED
jgi:hypothetical protein